jgi:GNAT superfamily N-acetyltransferase
MIRPYLPNDETAVVGVWHRAGLATYTFLPTWQSLTLETAARVFRDAILPNNKLWVCVDGSKIVAFMAMNGSLIDRMYVDPEEWGKGLGTRMIKLAKQLCPAGLELYTHVENHRARRFYEKHGFQAIKFGISPPPESAPDVEYHWRP